MSRQVYLAINRKLQTTAASKRLLPHCVVPMFIYLALFRDDATHRMYIPLGRLTIRKRQSILTDALAYFTMVPAMHCDLASCGSFKNYVDKMREIGGQNNANYQSRPCGFGLSLWPTNCLVNFSFFLVGQKELTHS